MKTLLPRILSIGIFAAATLPAKADFRAFTSSDGGKTIEAKIISANENEVTIEMKNGQVVTSAISRFSESDRKFIANWRESAPVGTAKMNFNCNPERVMLERNGKDTNSHKIDEEWWVYELPLENRSNAPAIDVEVRYRIYVKSEHEEGKNQKEYYFGHGILPVAKIPPGERLKLRTIKVPIYKSSLKSGYEHKDGRRNRNADELVGIWVKVFTKDGEFLWETKTPGKATNDYFFSNEDALKITNEPEKKK